MPKKNKLSVTENRERNLALGLVRAGDGFYLPEQLEQLSKMRVKAKKTVLKRNKVTK